MAITLDFNVKNGSVVKTTSIKEPSVERNFELRRSARFSSRESSVIKAEEKPFENPYHHKDTKGNRESFKRIITEEYHAQLKISISTASQKEIHPFVSVPFSQDYIPT